MHGPSQYCYVDDDVLFAVNGGANMDELKLGIGYTTDAHTLNFSSVQMSAEAADLLPITLDAWKSYCINFRKIGALWTLTSIDGPNQESED